MDARVADDIDYSVPGPLTDLAAVSRVALEGRREVRRVRDQQLGPAEIRGNAIRDLAALNKVEMLPWDEWGRMGASYQGQTGADYDGLLDAIADVSAADDPSAVAELYASDELRVPEELIA